jgi:hypothetical protein
VDITGVEFRLVEIAVEECTAMKLDTLEYAPNKQTILEATFRKGATAECCFR